MDSAFHPKGTDAYLDGSRQHIRQAFERLLMGISALLKVRRAKLMGISALQKLGKAKHLKENASEELLMAINVLRKASDGHVSMPF